ILSSLYNWRLALTRSPRVNERRPTLRNPSDGKWMFSGLGRSRIATVVIAPPQFSDSKTATNNSQSIRFRLPGLYCRSLFAGMICPLGVRLDLIQRKPRRLKLLPGIQPGLIKVVGRRGVAIFAENKNRPCFYLGAKIHDAYKRMSSHSIASLLAFFRPGVKVKNDAQPAWRSRNRQAVLAIAERLVAQRVSPLDSVYFAPGDFPAPKVPFQIRYDLLESLDRDQRIPIARPPGPHHLIEPERKQGHLG